MYYFVIYLAITTSNTNVFTPPQEQIIPVLPACRSEHPSEGHRRRNPPTLPSRRESWSISLPPLAEFIRNGINDDCNTVGYRFMMVDIDRELYSKR